MKINPGDLRKIKYNGNEYWNNVISFCVNQNKDLYFFIPLDPEILGKWITAVGPTWHGGASFLKSGPHIKEI